MSGFGAAVLIALGVYFFGAAEEWWPMGRKILGVLVVFGVVAVMVLGVEHYSSSGESLRAVLLGR